jgi:putative thioredoxin
MNPLIKPGPKSPHVIVATRENIQSIVEQSMTRLVLMDFWATWCQPCKTLSPALEALADEYKGAILLATVDVDGELKALAAQFQIQSVPTVFLLYKGQPVDAFQGALPVSEIRRVIDGAMEQLNIKPPAPVGPPTDPQKALKYWQEKVTANAGDGQALLALGRIQIRVGKVLDARGTFQKIDAKMTEYAAAQAALSTIGLMEQVTDAGGEEAVIARLEADPNDKRAVYLLACASAAKGETLEALDGFIGLVAKSPQDVKDDAKKAAATVFEAAGRENPDVEQRRKQLTRLLF